MTNAILISDFNNSVGVNTSITITSSSYQNYGQMMNALSFLGITNIRDTYDNPYTTAEFRLMANQLHLKFDFFVALGSVSPQWQMQQIASNPGIVSYVEGYNESDSWWQTYQGLTGVDATRAVQQDLYTFTKSTPSLAGVGVLQGTFANQSTSYPLYGDMSAYADYASTHSYFGTGNNPLGGVQPLIDTAQIATPGKPTITTEAGYFTMPGTVHGVSQTVQAKYLLNLLFDQAKAGVKLTYLWELSDNFADPANTDSEDHFGLFNYDWTPKLAALALHNLHQLMRDTSPDTTISPGSLDFAFSSALPSTAQTALYEKSDGTFILVVWNDVRLSGPSVQTDLIVAPVATTLQLQQRFASITIFDPLTGVGIVGSAQNTSWVNLQILDHPIIIQLSQSLPPSVSAITVPDQVITTPSQTVYVDGLSISPSKIGTLNVVITSNESGLAINDIGGHLMAQNVAALSFSGSVSDVNAELASLRYTATNKLRNDNISVTLIDSNQNTTTQFIPVSVVASPDPINSGGPTLSSPATLSTTLNSRLIIPQLFVADAYASTHPEVLTVKVLTSGGLLQAETSQATVTGNASTSLILTGSFSQIAATLSTLSYTGSKVGQDTILFTVADQSGFTSTDTTTVNVTNSGIRPQPTIATITGNVDGGVTLKGRSTPNSVVTVINNVNSKTNIIGSLTKTADNGDWSVTSHTKIDMSTINTFSVGATDTAGIAGFTSKALILTDTNVDQLTATAGVSEVFAIMSFKGADIIQGFQTKSAIGSVHDYINISGRGISSFAQVHSMMSGVNTTILSIGSGKTVTLTGVTPDSLTASDFVFS